MRITDNQIRWILRAISGTHIPAKAELQMLIKNFLKEKQKEAEENNQNN